MKNAGKTFALFALLAGSSGFGCAPTPASVEISPPDAVVHDKAEALTLTARVLDREDNPIPGAQVRWSTLDDKILSIDPATGAVTVKASGKAQVAADCEAASGTATVTVALFSRLAVDRPQIVLKIGEAQYVFPTISDENGKPIEAAVAWSSADPKIATVAEDKGQIRGVSPGTAIVTAAALNLKAQVEVEVMKPGPAELGVSTALLEMKVGQTEKVEGKPLDEAGKPAEGYRIGYVSDDESVAMVDADGTVVAVAAGEANIVVTAGDQTVTIKVTVEQ